MTTSCACATTPTYGMSSNSFASARWCIIRGLAKQSVQGVADKEPNNRKTGCSLHMSTHIRGRRQNNDAHETRSNELRHRRGNTLTVAFCVTREFLRLMSLSAIHGRNLTETTLPDSVRKEFFSVIGVCFTDCSVRHIGRENENEFIKGICRYRSRRTKDLRN